MHQETINGIWRLQLPDGFVRISDEELAGMSRAGGDPFRWGARDAEKHAVLLALWKEYNGLLARMADLKAIVRKNEQQTARAHAEYGYRLIEFCGMDAGEEKAEGFRFSYEREGITQVCSNLLIKEGKTVYAFMYIGRTEHAEADRESFTKIMESLEYC